MLGLDNESEQSLKDFLTKKSMRVDGNFVNPPAEEGSKHRFELNQDRIEQLTKIVQFLEQQKHELDI
jgi:hypothetical protein